MDGIGRVDEYLLDETAAYRDKRSPMQRWATVAACLVLAAGIGLGVPFLATIGRIGATDSNETAPGSPGMADTGAPGGSLSALTVLSCLTFDFSAPADGEIRPVEVEEICTVYNPTAGEIFVQLGAETGYPLPLSAEEAALCPVEVYLNGAPLDAVWSDGLLSLGTGFAVRPGEAVELRIVMTKLFRFEPEQQAWCASMEMCWSTPFEIARREVILTGINGLEIVEQNFGFDPAEGILKAELDPGVERYHLSVRQTEN